MLHISMNDIVKCCDTVCGVVEIGFCVMRILRNDVRVAGHIETSLLCCKNATK